MPREEYIVVDLTPEEAKIIGALTLLWRLEAFGSNDTTTAKKLSGAIDVLLLAETNGYVQPLIEKLKKTVISSLKQNL